MSDIKKSNSSNKNSGKRNSRKRSPRKRTPRIRSHRRTSIFSWVHLSDIHFQAEDESFATSRILSSLPVYLKSIYERRGKKRKCDAIIISGDFRYAPRSEQTTAADVCEYIRSLSLELDVKNDKIFIVPGNHDLNRNPVRDSIIFSLTKGIKDGEINEDCKYKPRNGVIDKDMLNQLSNDFIFYNAIQNVFSKGLKLNGENPHQITELDSCYLLLLNTSLIAGTDKDQNQLIIGGHYLKRLLDSRNYDKPIIAIGHHGLDMLNNAERKTISIYLDEKNVRLYLSGHIHDTWIQPYGQSGKQISVGCLTDDKDVEVGFSIGTLYDNGDVQIDMYMWNNGSQKWQKDKNNSQPFPKLYKGCIVPQPSSPRQKKVPESESGFHLRGSYKINTGAEGIKWVWEKIITTKTGSQNLFVESVTNNQRYRLNPTSTDKKTSRYSISTSFGCQLSTFKSECVFCDVSKNTFLPLTADEIALQCIFMAEYDSDCPDFEEYKCNQREFAFMGQGEPGFSYPMVKRAILLTDAAMKKINQKVSEYVIYTSGITDFIPDLITDYKKKLFSKRKLRVKVHFSLNTIDDRDSLMPINKLYPYKEFIQQCKSLYEVTHEKIEVGIIMMVNYKTNENPEKDISIDINKLKAILDELDEKYFTIELCTVNKTTKGTQPSMNIDINKFLNVAHEQHFECRPYSSFGNDIESGCGQITSSVDDLHEPGASQEHIVRALELLKEAKQIIDGKATGIPMKQKELGNQ